MTRASWSEVVVVRPDAASVAGPVVAALMAVPSPRSAVSANLRLRSRTRNATAQVAPPKSASLCSAAMVESVGRVPLRIRIGVTGHRTLADEPAVSARVDEVLFRLQEILPSTPTTSVLFEVVSPLGEGADRIVADRVLRYPSSILEVPLPLPASDYEGDFGSEASRRRFGALLERAHHSWTVGGSDRVDAYRRTGEYVVESCDLLIAIWDGEPSRGAGGTGDILELARTRRMPVFVIGSRPPYAIAQERIPEAFRLLREVDGYDRVAVPASEAGSTRLLPSSVELSGEEGHLLERCIAWVELPFRRADSLAERYRSRFRWTSRSMFLMSALAILAAAVSIAAREQGVQRTFAWLEVVFMVGALGLWLLIRRRLHSRWITARFLAERLRSALFLVFVDPREALEPTPEGEYRGNSQEWVTRVYREVWRTRPPVDRRDREVARVKDLLGTAWADPQVGYYRRRGGRHAAAVRGITAASAILFATTIAAAFAHAAELVQGAAATRVAILSVALPAFAGALTGIAALEQHERHAERFRLMARRLDELRDRLQRAEDLDRVRDIALLIESELRTETDAWIDVMRYHDVELPV